MDCFLGKGGRLCLKPKVRRVQAIIKDYASIISTDGNVNDNELKEWLLLDDEIENKSTKNIEKLINEIKKSAGYLDRMELSSQRMSLYKQGLTDNEIADIQEVTPMAIYYWRKIRGLKSNYVKKRGRKKSD